MECTHKFESREQVKKFGNYEFNFDAETCIDCGTYIWDENVDQNKLDKWLIENDIKQTVSFRHDVYLKMKKLKIHLIK